MRREPGHRRSSDPERQSRNITTATRARMLSLGADDLSDDLTSRRTPSQGHLDRSAGASTESPTRPLRGGAATGGRRRPQAAPRPRPRRQAVTRRARRPRRALPRPEHGSRRAGPQPGARSPASPSPARRPARPRSLRACAPDGAGARARGVLAAPPQRSVLGGAAAAGPGTSCAAGPPRPAT